VTIWKHGQDRAHLAVVILISNQEFLVVRAFSLFVPTRYAYANTTFWTLPFEFTPTFCFHQEEAIKLQMVMEIDP
jgi:hypothetical protein